MTASVRTEILQTHCLAGLLKPSCAAERSNGCGKCVSVCPRNIIEIVPSDSEENMIKINFIKNKNSFKFWKFWYNILYKENGNT